MDCSDPSLFHHTNTCSFEHQNAYIVKMSLTFEFAHRGHFNPLLDSQTVSLPVCAASELYFATAQNSLNAV